MGANYGQLRQLAENLHRAEQGMTEFKRQLALGEGLYAVKQAKKICTDFAAARYSQAITSRRRKILPCAQPQRKYAAGIASASWCAKAISA